MVGKYKVITLCGSTRFKDVFMETQKRLTLEGNIVISVGLFGHSGDDEVWTEGTKECWMTCTNGKLIWRMRFMSSTLVAISVPVPDPRSNMQKRTASQFGIWSEVVDNYGGKW